MPETIYWEDQAAYQTFIDAGRAVFARIRGQLHGQRGVVAIEPSSGAYYVGRTLGKANDAAYERHPDTWLYFVRLDDPSAEIALPTW
jgi:hypothetical protein